MTRADAIEWLEWLKKYHTEEWIQEALDIAIQYMKRDWRLP